MNLPNPFPSNVNSSAQKGGTNGALLVFLLDKSGSMDAWTRDTIGGFNTFLNKQKEEPGETFVTTCLFDTSYTYLYQNRPANVVYNLTNKEYQAGGGTALLDAFGATIESTDAYLATLPQDKRPAVIFVVMTDGEENSSRTHFKEPDVIKNMVAARQEMGWAFTFLGANIDAFHAGSSLGFAAGATANYTQTSTKAAFASASGLVSRYRSAARAGQDMTTSAEYLSSERTAMTSGENE